MAARAGRRPYLAGGRPVALTLALSTDEAEVIRAAAEAAGLAVGAFAARAAYDVARDAVRPVPVGRREVLAALADAQRAVTRFGVNVNQAVARLHATGEVTAALDAAVVACTRATSSLDDAAVRVARMRS